MSSTFILEKEVRGIKRYICLYCDKQHLEREAALACLDGHKLILLPIAQKDLGRLNQFLYVKDDNLLTPELVKTIQKYARQVARSQ